MKKKVLIIGSGGREHAIGWKLSQSPKVDRLFFAPGNGGTSQLGKNINIDADNFKNLVDFAKKENIDITIVGPDNPLALGVVDVFKENGLRIFGPSKKAARIEASKEFSKNLMKDNEIPTAKFESFDDYEEAVDYLKRVGAPIVIKASGLALGKGVYVCKTLKEAQNALVEIIKDNKFGDAGKTVVIEEFLEGQEVSFHLFTDGSDYKLFPTAQDHKPIYDGDKGPNTGGMGAFTPVPWVNNELIEDVSKNVVERAIKGLVKVNSTFIGCLYPGLMVSKNGFKVLEFNARLGDPETQAYMRLLKTDLLDIVEACIDGNLKDIDIEWENKFAICVVMASGGYPGEYKKGFEITGLDRAAGLDDVVIFHAGTKSKNDKYYTNGGRVLGITAVADTLQGAIDRSYEAVRLIDFEGMQYRKDIGAKALTFFIFSFIIDEGIFNITLT